MSVYIDVRVRLRAEEDTTFDLLGLSQSEFELLLKMARLAEENGFSYSPSMELEVLS